MHILAQPLVHALTATLFTSACLAGVGSNPAMERAPVRATWLNQPIGVTLEARTVEHDAAFGMHIVRPIFQGRVSAVLLEAYGFEGEGELGLVGGGAIYRTDIGRRSGFEASAFFEGLRSTDGFSYPQFGAGLVFSMDRWLRLSANGYLPLRGKDRVRDGSDRFTETEGSGAGLRDVSYSRDRFSERAPMRGFDVEAEFRLSHPPRWVDPRLAIGYAYREAEDRPEVYAGPLVRGELHFGKHWVAESEWRHDMHGADQEWRVGIRFETLFGGPKPRVERPAVASNGKNAVPLEDAAEPADDRASERYLPVQRFPWPTLARGVTRGKPRRGDTRLLAPAPASAPAPADPGDCCPSGNAPLIFD